MAHLGPDRIHAHQRHILLTRGIQAAQRGDSLRLGQACARHAHAGRASALCQVRLDDDFRLRHTAEGIAGRSLGLAQQIGAHGHGHLVAVGL